MANLGRESETLEFKESTVELEDALIAMVAMLNKRRHGTICFGVRNDGEVIGQDVGKRTITKISQAFKNHIDPAVIPRIDVMSEEGKEYLMVRAEGSDRPYAFRGDIYIRSGEENKRIPMSELRKLFQSSSDLLRMSKAVDQNLTFGDLCYRLVRRGLHAEDGPGLHRGYSLLNDKGEFNIQAELLSDQNPLPLAVVVFSGIDRSEISTRKQFTGPLLKSMGEAYSYVESLNESSIDMSRPVRTERELINLKAFDEAWTNACVHNTWMLGIPPTVHIFRDRIEVISYGGIPYYQSEEEFFRGETMPVNESLMQVFLAAGVTEHTGHGVPVIVDAYGRESFQMDGSSVRVVMRFPFERGGGVLSANKTKTVADIESRIIMMMMDDPGITLASIASNLGISRSSIGKKVDILKEKGVIRREGSKKKGTWTVIGEEKRFISTVNPQSGNKIEINRGPSPEHSTAKRC